jgi:hypothetical protein
MKYVYSSIFGIAIFLLAVQAVHAATLYFDPEERTVGSETPFLVGVMATAEETINTLNISIDIPRGFEPLDVSNGNSIINFWIDKPHFDALTRKLTFSGIIPGGFSGVGARVAIISLQANSLGNFTIAFDKSTFVTEHTASATRAMLTTVPVAITVVEGRENIENLIPDDERPEEFTPEVVKLHTSSSSPWVVIFNTQDKNSGLAYYAVTETPTKSHRIASTDWRVAESPYILTDQTLKSYIHVRAVDKEGNERIVTVPPRVHTPWRDGVRKYILIISILIICAAMYLVYRLRKYRRDTHGL